MKQSYFFKEPNRLNWLINAKAYHSPNHWLYLQCSLLLHYQFQTSLNRESYYPGEMKSIKWFRGWNRLAASSEKEKVEGSKVNHFSWEEVLVKSKWRAKRIILNPNGMIILWNYLRKGYLPSLQSAIQAFFFSPPSFSSLFKVDNDFFQYKANCNSIQVSQSRASWLWHK